MAARVEVPAAAGLKAAPAAMPRSALALLAARACSHTLVMMLHQASLRVWLMQKFSSGRSVDTAALSASSVSPPRSAALVLHRLRWRRFEEDVEVPCWSPELARVRVEASCWSGTWRATQRSAMRSRIKPSSTSPSHPMSFAFSISRMASKIVNLLFDARVWWLLLDMCVTYFPGWGCRCAGANVLN